MLWLRNGHAMVTGLEHRVQPVTTEWTVSWDTEPVAALTLTSQFPVTQKYYLLQLSPCFSNTSCSGTWQPASGSNKGTGSVPATQQGTECNALNARH